MTDTTCPTPDEGNSSTEILKADRLGRVRVGVERREAMLSEYDRSGLTAPQFARLMGIKYQTFATWLQARRKRETAVKPVRFLEAVFEPESKCGPEGTGRPVESECLMVQAGGAIRMEVRTVAQATLAAVILREMELKPAARPC